MSSRTLAALVALTLITAAGTASAQAIPGRDDTERQLDNTGRSERDDRKPVVEPAPAPDAPFDLRKVTADERTRYAPAAFPFATGNSDTGIALGIAGNLTRFHGDDQPYSWALSSVLTTSFKGGEDGSGGLSIVQYDYLLRFVSPSAFNNRLRLDVVNEVVRTIDAGYWGVGNGTTATLPPMTDNFGRKYEYQHTEARNRIIARVHTDTPLDIVFGAQFRYEQADNYAGSKLAEDLAPAPNGKPSVLGGARNLIGGVAAGFMLDTRDTEFITRRGLFYQVGAGVTAGTEEHVVYGNASAVLSNYVPITPRITFAHRLVASFEFGNVPFYDLQQGGTFEPQYLIGSGWGVRGVPLGRYAGKVKLVSNAEMRFLPFNTFHVFSHPVLIGNTAFLDLGRAFAEYRFDPALDGHGVALKYGIGGGVFVFYGSSALFRIDVSYSPDAVSENPHLPVGIYFNDGLMF